MQYITETRNAFADLTADLWQQSPDLCYIIAPNCAVLAYVYGTASADKTTATEARRNARLICGAPDLLAALVRLVDEHADLGEVDLSTNEREALDQARAAIARAKGTP